MTILASDIRQRASNVMADVPEGGGGPSGNFILDGTSNMIFPDVTEAARAGGQVSIRQLFLSVVTPDSEEFMDANLIVAQPPNDANVSITLAKCAMFHRRTDIANAIENYLIQGPEWGGYLLENHVAGQRSVQIFQRPGTPVPPVGRTLVLIYEEGTPSERRQYVRVTRTETEERMFTYGSGGDFVDYAAAVVNCEISDALRESFPGSPPERSFARDPVKTVIRDTTIADAATYYGAVPLSAVAALGDQSAKVTTVYSQLVPSARTETVALDQRPASQRTIVLAEAPRRIEVGASPHTQRIKVGQENRGFSYTAILSPLPEPGTLVISFLALGNWYTVVDDGVGAFTGSGSGQVMYGTGSLAITFPSMPDVGSSVIIQWGERVGFTDRSAQGAAIRPPEYSWLLDEDGVVPGSLALTWLSGAVLRTANDDGAGKITGDGVGVIDYPSGSVLLRPSYLPDPGADINVAYDTDSVVMETFASPGAPDAGGFITLNFSQQPAAGTLAIQWATARTVSNTSGGQQSTTSATKGSTESGIGAASIFSTRPTPATYSPAQYTGAGAGSMPVTWLVSY